MESVCKFMSLYELQKIILEKIHRTIKLVHEVSIKINNI